jgi:hypothetical protein
MASELRVNTLKDASGNNSIATSFVAGGSAKAWVNFNGTGTIAARDSLNVGSLTDSGTGDYLINYSSSFANTNYSPTAVNGGVTGAPRDVTVRSFTTNSVALYTTNSSEALFDCDTICLSFHGDLA